jgi:hypothetical protein
MPCWLTPLVFGGTGAVSEVSPMMVACIKRWAPAGSSYQQMLGDVELFTQKCNRADMHLRAILVALKRDYEQGQVSTFEELVHAAVFDDFVAQVEYYVDEGHLYRPRSFQERPSKSTCVSSPRSTRSPSRRPAPMGSRILARHRS